MASSVSSLDDVRNVHVGTLNLGTYAAGGIAVSGSQVNCPNKLQALVIAPSSGYVFEYVPSTGKVKAYLTGAALSGVLAEAGSVSLSSINPLYIAIGY